jgi:DNA-binding CsgD family transcriptional regulator
VVGREQERARIGGLLEAARRGRAGTLVVVGEPGIGKTALLEDARAAASAMRVLQLTGVEAESALPFAGLHALLRPLADLLVRLDAAYENALRTALVLTSEEPPDILAVNAGLLALLAEAAAEQPLVVIVDDAQWLDPPTSDALAFAARRIAGEELALLVSARTDEPSAFDSGFEQLALGPLAPTAARELLASRADSVPAGSVDRLLELAGGNPLALLELPVELALEVPGATPSTRLQRAFAARLEPLPPETRQALVLAAAEPDPAAVRRAAHELGLGDAMLADAESAGLVRLGPDGVAFRHPIVRSLAYASADPVRRRETHRALAAVLDAEEDRDRRAWHLAAAATEPDEELAALLEETAARAESRGGHAAAGRALERAARLSVDPDARARRLTGAARATSWSGDVERGELLAEEAIASTRDPLLRSDALLELESQRAPQAEGDSEDRLLAQVGEIDELDADRAIRLLIAVMGKRGTAFDGAGAAELAPRIEETARRAGSWWGPRALGTAAVAYLAIGETSRFEELTAEIRDNDAVVANFALDLLWAEEYDLARSALESSLREGRAQGNVMRAIWNQACIATLELRLGRLQAARLAAAEAITLGDARGMSLWAGIADAALAGVHAWQGDEAGCRAAASLALASARQSRSLSDEVAACSPIGVLALGLGRPQDVVDELEPLAVRWEGSTVVEPSAVAFIPDLVEAHAQLRQLDEARRRLDRFASAAARARRQWALAAVARCEGILAGSDFAQHFEHALQLLDASPLTFERARTQLAYGERLRRAGRRREARTHLRAAHAAFAAVDALPWAERAAAELRAAGEPVGRRDPDREASLTAQELQIAHLVADGLTNKEIAARLYLSPKTIEYHLGNTYRKLDVHSRAELGRIIGAPELSSTK